MALDLDPTITVDYLCASGSTSLSKVVVHNWLAACCMIR
jgi:hypothetical protein